MQQVSVLEKVPTPGEEGEEMELGELDLEGMEETCLEKVSNSIPPQQVSLLEKSITKKKGVK